MKANIQAILAMAQTTLCVWGDRDLRPQDDVIAAKLLIVITFPPWLGASNQVENHLAIDMYPPFSGCNNNFPPPSESAFNSS